MNNTFELETISDNNNELEIKDYETTKALVENYVSKKPAFIITDDDGWRLAKDTRAELNKFIKLIDRTRIDSINDFVSIFKEQCDTLKKLFSDLEKDYAKEIHTYEENKKSVGVPKAKIITATLKFYDEKLIEKITKFATENGCELVVKNGN